MSGKSKKYYLNILSVVMLISFLNVNLSLCTIIADSCSMDKTSCCCKDSEQKTSTAVKLEKKCCCEIKEMTNQPADINLSLTESISKNLSHTSEVYSVITFNNDNFNSGYFKVLSFHSPPKEKLNILNSNFRI